VTYLNDEVTHYIRRSKALIVLKYHIMNTYGGVGVQPHTLTSALDIGE